MKYVSLHLALLAILGWSGVARADHYLALSADMGLGAVDGQAHAGFLTSIDIREGNLSLSLAGRLRLTMASDDSPLIRERDFDEVGDYLHILRFFDYHRRFEHVEIKLKAGELRGKTLGHGSLMRSYSNIADPDHLHSGAIIGAQFKRFDIELMLDNMANPMLFGGRVSFLPFSKLKKLRVGVTSVLDRGAPNEIGFHYDGRPQLNRYDQFQIEDRAFLSTAAIDVEYRIGNEKNYLLPYVDLATNILGLGLHAGAQAELALKKNYKMKLHFEYRLSSDHYAPSLFRTFYDVERMQSRLSASTTITPLYQALSQGGYGGHGLFGEVALINPQKVQAKIGYRYHPGPEGSQAWVRFLAQPTKELTLGTLILYRGIGQNAGSEGVAALVESRYRLSSSFYLSGQYTRLWAVDPDSQAYQSADQFNVALGGVFAR